MQQVLSSKLSFDCCSSVYLQQLRLLEIRLSYFDTSHHFLCSQVIMNDIISKFTVLSSFSEIRPVVASLDAWPAIEGDIGLHLHWVIAGHKVITRKDMEGRV